MVSRTFVLLFVGTCVALGGAAGFVVAADYDHHYHYSESLTESPPGAYSVPYDELSPENRRTVDRAVEGYRFTFEEESQVPPQIVRKDGEYLRFVYTRTFDWTDPRTFGPAGLAVTGLAMAVHAVRLDIRSAPTV